MSRSGLLFWPRLGGLANHVRNGLGAWGTTAKSVGFYPKAFFKIFDRFAVKRRSHSRFHIKSVKGRKGRGLVPGQPKTEEVVPKA